MRLISRFHGTARWMSCALAALALVSGSAKADNLPMTHPTVDLVKKYFRYVIEQNWREAAKMIRPSSIERKKKETLAIIKSAPTMSEEAAMLGRLGVKDLKELEKMSVEDFYIADRQSFQRPQSATNEDVQKQKRESLKVNVLGVVGEQDNKIIHLVVRTSQEVIDQRIDEIFFISFTQDEVDGSKWVIAPDIQRPVTEPLKTPAKPAAAPAPAPEVKAETNPDIKVAPNASKKK